MFRKIADYAVKAFQKCKKTVLGLGAAVGLGAAAAAPSHAAAILDLSTASTAITTELTAALPAAVTIGGTLIAIGVGWKLFRRFTKGS